MNTRSYIQRVIEETDRKESFRKQLTALTEKYDVKGNVFAIGYRGGSVEVVQGYLCEEKTFESLSECVREMKPNQAVRINEGSFILGTVYNMLSECTDGKVLDIERLQYIRE